MYPMHYPWPCSRVCIHYIKLTSLRVLRTSLNRLLYGVPDEEGYLAATVISFGT